MTTILIVDDAAFIRMRTTTLLTENGCDVVEASNGAEAVDAYEARLALPRVGQGLCPAQAVSAPYCTASRSASSSDGSSGLMRISQPFS